MNINRLRWLSERIIDTEKEEFYEFIDTKDKEMVSFVVEACYEKKPTWPTDLFIILKNAVSKREEILNTKGAKYSSFDSSYFSRALESFTAPYTFEKYKRLQALFDIINIDPKYLSDAAIKSIMLETTFTDEIHIDCCLDAKKAIICYPGFTDEEKTKMLDLVNKSDVKPNLPPHILENFFEYLNLKDIFKQDYSKFGDMEHKLRKAMVNYIIDDYSGHFELLNDFSLFKKLSHFKDTFNDENMELLPILINAKNIYVFLISTEFIKKIKQDDIEGLKILMEQFVNADTVTFGQMQCMIKNEEFIKKPIEEKLADFEKITEKAKILNREYENGHKKN